MPVGQLLAGIRDATEVWHYALVEQEPQAKVALVRVLTGSRSIACLQEVTQEDVALSAAGRPALAQKGAEGLGILTSDRTQVLDATERVECLQDRLLNVRGDHSSI